ncbi:hypothetical protein [Sphingomonas sp. TX0522]|uniref:hypothetical protein n=1 Tax=Sphingomonas sp. TX0522 TaxID=2479205 RepID=UPI0018DFF0F5|nr:hypothetical protein [Sphingomonas sp. TX0522]MBI0530078.1 hypothetical protein [Sphingomonas sp. TX0522]
MGFQFDFETACAFLILAFFGWVIWRGGSANPVGTGQLQKQLQAIGVKVTGLEGKLGDCASVEALEKLRGELQAMEERVASSGEVIALEGKINALGERMNGVAEMMKRTDAGVQRIEGYFLERGVNR